MQANSLHQPHEAVTSAEAALQFLIEGNARFAENRCIERSVSDSDRAAYIDGQHPFAAVVTCSDSRVPPELFFDQRPGDIFVVRNAGNIADGAALGSIEYAGEHLSVPLIVVVGHSSCGAVTSALEPHDGVTGCLRGILETIGEAINGCGCLDDAICANVRKTVEDIRSNEVIKHLGTTVLGAYYNIADCRVRLLDEA